MNLQSLTTFAVAFLMFLNLAEARLGESTEQTDARYGKEIRNEDVSLEDWATNCLAQTVTDLRRFNVTVPDCSTYHNWQRKSFSFRRYKFGKFYIMVIYQDGKSVFEAFSPTDAAEAEKLKLMEVNSGGNQWLIMNGRDGEKREAWKTIDNATRDVARYFYSESPSKGPFIIFEKKLIDYCNSESNRITAEEAKKKSKPMEGL